MPIGVAVSVVVDMVGFRGELKTILNQHKKRRRCPLRIKPDLRSNESRRGGKKREKEES
jgi:hypothetical protein